MSEPNSFTTSFGHRINFIPGYFDRNAQVTQYMASAPLEIADFDFEHLLTDLHLKIRDPSRPLNTHIIGRYVTPSVPAKDWVMFSGIIRFLKRFGLLRAWRRGIDLGGGEGVCIRFMKAAGYLNHATNLDLLDYSPYVSDDYFAALIQLYKEADIVSGPAAGAIRNSIERAKWHYDVDGGSPLLTGLHQDFPDAPTLDENVVMDFLDAPGTYDFVMTACTIDFLDLEDALPKVRSLLEPGGLFVGHVDHWWWATNATGLMGHFPYACQRLSFPDLQRYYQAHHPEFEANLRRYNYFHKGQQHPTINDWTTLGLKHGLKLVAMERVIPQKYHLMRDCPPDFFKEPWFDPLEVLRDIHCLKPDVTLEDLQTSALRVAFMPV